MITFDVDVYRNIDGNLTLKQPVGYCFCLSHKGYLTKNELETHQCLKKECHHLLKNKDHSYWGSEYNPSIKKRYKNLIYKGFEIGIVSEDELKLLKIINDIEFMEKYVKEHKFNRPIREEYQTKSNYVAKKIIHPKKPSLYARIKNMIKIKYKRFIKNMTEFPMKLKIVC